MIHGRIYKIFCNETGECYYGSTEQTLSRRLSVHKKDYKSWKKAERGYVSSYKIIERGNFTISLMEEGDFENKDFMKARERHYIENNECVNKNVPNRTKKEYYEANKENIAEQQKQYNEANKEHITEKKKEYYEANKERITEQIKEYREAHREQRVEYDKELYEKNKEKILEKFTCACGKVICRGSKKRHEKSKKHLAYIEQK
jgi:hypothetical protein